MSQSLFSALLPETCEGLARLEAVLAEVAPLKSTHRKDLPHAIRDLSLLLTQDRAEMERPYWATPRLFSAYLRYFLPWNLVRLGRLLPGLTIDRENLVKNPLVLDMGSGPLTLPIALWLARPDLRGLPLTILATDNAPQPLLAGKRIFQALTGENCAWTVHTLRGQVPAILREARAPVGLLTGANILNELLPRRNEPLEERFYELMEKADRALATTGQMLLVEPGTRLGGKCISLTRSAALEHDFSVLTPCPHGEDCPMLAPKSTSWCHFSMLLRHTSDIPPWLEKLSKAADLQKTAASLSFLLLSKQGQISEPPAQQLLARVVSGPIQLPGREPGRYACTANGLVLLENARDIPAASLLPVTWPELPERDEKSGAWRIPLPKAGREAGQRIQPKQPLQPEQTGQAKPEARRAPQARVKKAGPEKGHSGKGKKFEPNRGKKAPVDK